MTTVAVVGMGAWGTALAAHAARTGATVKVWAREAEVVDEINARHENTPFLPGIALPLPITASTDVAEVVRGAEIVILVPPSQHLRAVAAAVAPHLAKRAVVVVATKGIEEGTRALMLDVVTQTMPDVGPDCVAVLSGPSFAREVVTGLPTNVVVASKGGVAARVVQKALHASSFRVYTSSDPIGVQIGGAIKNVIAVAAGAVDGLGLGTNARAAIVTRGLAEMTRLGVALGADALTFLGLAGVGDLILTCTGSLSRNRELGMRVAEGADPKTFLASKRSVAEGFSTSAAAYDLARAHGVDAPITEQVFHVLHEGRPLLEALERLVTRDFKEELTGIRTAVHPVAGTPPEHLGAAVAAVVARLRPELLPLAHLAYNLWWSWQPAGRALFREIDPDLWSACGESPLALLAEASPAALDRAAANADYVARVDAMERALQAELSKPAAATPPATPERPIALMCAEYGIHASFPIYAGGLGALAGDMLKEASDRALPLVGVGLLYRRGYFRQRLDPSGWQHEYWTETRAERLPVLPATDGSGQPLKVRVPMRDREVVAQVWRAQVGRVPLYLLDTDVPENSPIDRWITAQLYVSDREFRLMQYAVLGIGGVRALAALGIDPSVVHLNEGHAALAALELIRQRIEGGATFDDAVAATRARVVFTTHTPVAAGNETYAIDEVARVLGDPRAAFGVDAAQLAALARAASGDPQLLGMTELGLRTSRHANGVSRRHGEVARAMWAPLWQDRHGDAVPITHVTNGVHLPTWMSPAMRALLDRHLGPEWTQHAADPWRWKAIDDIPDEELWAVRNDLRRDLVEYVRRRSMEDRLARGEPIRYVEAAARTFDPHVLTVGFARRVASYKRLHLLIRNPPRALALLRGPRPIQVLIAGKAHPHDEGAKRFVQTIFTLKGEPDVGSRVAFLEDYDLAMATRLVAGCDVWLNVPRPPLEASGTSGMKAAMNGGLNLSVLDGWWREAFDGGNGWAIRDDGAADDEGQDARDAEQLYTLLEREVVPLFHERDASGVPRGWVRRIKASLRTLGPTFNASRMAGEYAMRVYPAAP